MFSSGLECDVTPPYKVNGTAKGRYDYDPLNPNRKYQDKIRYWYEKLMYTCNDKM